jgi:uncharacterized protein (TIGR00299 family) protein
MSLYERIVVIDSQVAGVAGDMFLAALVDAGASAEKITSAIKTLEAPEFGYGRVNVDVKRVVRKGFQATKVDVTSEKNPRKNSHELVQTVEEATARLNLSTQAKRYASNTVRTLVNAESIMHPSGLEGAHFHEVALVDMPAEVIGVAVALEELGLFNSKVYATPVSVGGGLFSFSHGTLSSPAPATLAILQSKQFPFRGGPAEYELATPTGVALLVNMAHEACICYPAMIAEKTGYGAGQRDYPEMPNVMRVIIGRPLTSRLASDEVTVLETNVDDVGGEILGNVVEHLLKAGAKDVAVIPALAKKGRPGFIIQLLSEKKDAARLSRMLMEHTGTLGVRLSTWDRFVLDREFITVDVEIKGVSRVVTVKVSRDLNGQILNVKPEYEEAKTLAIETCMPLREVLQIVREAAEKRLFGGKENGMS